jgi:hypothetical protein
MMFLDEKLYQHVKARELEMTTPVKVNELMQELIKICEDHWKPQVKAGISKSRMIVHWDRTFKSWDLFIERLKRDDSQISHQWALLFGEHSYKKAFFDDERFAKFYKDCKTNG